MTVYSVFLSYNGDDREAVERIARYLRDKARLNPWFDQWSLIPGEPWVRGLYHGLSGSASCAVFVGPTGVGPWQMPEVEQALQLQVRRPGFRVVPVLLPGAPNEPELPPFLAGNTWVDLRTSGRTTREEGLRRLQCAILGVPPGGGRLIRRRARTQTLARVRQLIRGLVRQPTRRWHWYTAALTVASAAVFVPLWVVPAFFFQSGSCRLDAGSWELVRQTSPTSLAEHFIQVAGPDEAAVCLRTLQDQLNSKDPNGVARLEAAVGELKMSQRAYDEAPAHFEAAAEKASVPAQVDYLKRAGDAYFLGEQIHEAIERYDAALDKRKGRADEQYTKLLTARALALFADDQDNQAENSLEDARDILVHLPRTQASDFLEYTLNQVYILIEKHDLDTAEKLLRQVPAQIASLLKLPNDANLCGLDVTFTNHWLCVPLLNYRGTLAYYRNAEPLARTNWETAEAIVELVGADIDPRYAADSMMSLAWLDAKADDLESAERAESRLRKACPAYSEGLLPRCSEKVTKCYELQKYVYGKLASLYEGIKETDKAQVSQRKYERAEADVEFCK